MSRHDIPTVLDIIPQMKTGTGFFSSFTSPMWNEDYTASKLDIFYAMTYGQKHPAPFLTMFIDEDTGKIDNEDLAVIANTIYEIRGQEWTHWYNDLKAEYNPIENTDVTEILSEEKEGENNSGNVRTLNTSTVNDGQASVSSETSGSGSGAGNVYGFDSVSAVGHDTNSNLSSGTSSTTTTTSNTVGDSGTISDDGGNDYQESIDRTTRKHGNIGIQTAADMIEHDLELWKQTFIIKVMDDISALTSLSVY